MHFNHREIKCAHGTKGERQNYTDSGRNGLELVNRNKEGQIENQNERYGC